MSLVCSILNKIISKTCWLNYTSMIAYLEFQGINQGKYMYVKIVSIVLGFKRRVIWKYDLVEYDW